MNSSQWWMRGMQKLLGALISLLITCGVGAGDLRGRVVGVLDGDTIDLLDSTKALHRIRLAGIDAPEKKMPFGQRSKQNLSALVFGRQVDVIGSKTDRYGRLVGKILVGGRDANLEQVSSGMAWHYKKYQKEQPLQDRLEYGEAENRARAARRGLWADPNPIPPWEWRRGSKHQDSLGTVDWRPLAAYDGLNL